MKIKLYLLCLTVFVAFQSFGQEKKAASPKETVKGQVDKVNVEIVYCRPSARGRKIMGGLVPYGEVWRTGANAATTFEIDKSVKIEGSDLAAGKYELFTIPGEHEWTIVFQKYTNQWGAFSYKKENDVLRVNVKPEKTDSFVETFTIGLEKDRAVLSWENTKVSFKIKG